jgi:hypothetical protein
MIAGHACIFTVTQKTADDFDGLEPFLRAILVLCASIVYVKVVIVIFELVLIHLMRDRD